MQFRLLTLSSLALATTIALAGCGTDSDGHGSGHGGESPSTAATASAGATASASSHNEADAMFATMMIPHHRQAIEMSDMLLAKDDVDPQVAELARDIKEAQGPEIDQLETWTEEWNVEPGHGSGHMGHGDGMMSEDDMNALEDADGQAASKLFLEQMIEHHEGAVDMAQTEVDDGQHAEAVDMAKEIVSSQTEEIETMRSLLDEL